MKKFNKNNGLQTENEKFVKKFNSTEQSEYERFVKNFNLIDQLYRNQGLSPEIMLVVLNDHLDQIYKFIKLHEHSRYSIKAKELYCEMADYIKDLKQENIY